MIDHQKQSDSNTETHFELGEQFRVKNIKLPKEKVPKESAGRRSRTISTDKRGRYTKSALPNEKPNDIAFDATIRAAAPYQKSRQSTTHGPSTIDHGLIIEPEDIREKVREKKVGNLVLFVVDSSGSMAANKRMMAAKGAIFSLLVDSYEKRDRVGMIAFKGDKAEVLLSPTNSVELASARLKELPTGGKTPLSSGLQLGLETIQRELRKSKRLATLLVLITDGKANVSMQKDGKPFEEAKIIAHRIKEIGTKSIIIDTETGFIRLGRLQELSEVMEGKYYHLEDIKADTISNLVKGAINL